MKQCIFEHSCNCPCNAEKDLESSDNVYIFLQELYGDLAILSREKYNINDLECAYCLIKSALETVKLNKQKYSRRKIYSLTTAKNRITEFFLEQTLDRIRNFIYS
ncbi:hypothetical protein [Bacteroides sp.]|uniref:hypothetical protein n=1 Tax=Bacteroides sp. TaxID=29523 RepID=UPI0026311FD9|nr:hypothetical protein [Bacteroides sp.]MDD3038833.1 hypothetical protein [Bacteroides sp.]